MLLRVALSIQDQSLVNTTGTLLLSILVRRSLPKAMQPVSQSVVGKSILHPILELAKRSGDDVPQRSLLGYGVTGFTSTPSVKQALGKAMSAFNNIGGYGSVHCNVCEELLDSLQMAGSTITICDAQVAQKWRAKLNVTALVAGLLLRFQALAFFQHPALVRVIQKVEHDIGK